MTLRKGSLRARDGLKSFTVDSKVNHLLVRLVRFENTQFLIEILYMHSCIFYITDRRKRDEVVREIESYRVFVSTCRQARGLSSVQVMKDVAENEQQP